MTTWVTGLDHVAIAVRDVAKSVDWYRRVLGLQRMYEDAWGDYPAMVGAGGTAIALFPVEGDQPQPPPGRDTLTMRHLAFRASRAGYEGAKQHLQALGIEYEFQDHQISHSIYFFDPDGLEIEITTYEVS